MFFTSAELESAALRYCSSKDAFLLHILLISSAYCEPSPTLSKYPSLMRPVTLVEYRYNEHLSPGSLILEVGSNGNTLQEALAAIRLFADAAGPALLQLVE